MADTQDISSVKKSDWNGTYVPKHTANLIKAGIENGTAPFIPQNGQVLTPLVYNANTGFALEGKDMIPVLLTKAANGYESNSVGTYSTMAKAHTKINEGEKGVWYNFKGKDGEFHHAAYFFGEQTEHPQKFQKFAQKNLKQPQNLSNQTIKISSSDMTEYLGAYMAACKSGAKLEVSPEVAEQFKEKIIAVADNELKRTNAEKNPTIPKLTDLLTSAEKKSSEIIKDREKELGIGQKKSQQFKPKEHKRKPVEMER